MSTVLPPNLKKATRRCVLALLLAGLAACSSKEQFFGIDITGADYATGFSTLTDHNGQQRSLADFKGKVVVLFFGYTQCPDFCPTSMAELAQVKKKLGQEGERLQVLFVTLDPERDTPEVLKAYMAGFDPSFLALRAGLERTAEVAKHYKVFFKKSEGKTPTSYTVDHSTGSYVYDTQGRIRIYTRQSGGADALLGDVKILLR